jgi:hypothetical protein
VSAATKSVGIAVIVASLAPARARAQSTSSAATAPPEKPDRVEHWVDFRANRVEIEPEAGALELSGAVVVTSRRFRLTSEAVTLTRTGRGVHVEGKGDLALCACARPPVTFGFAAADLAPPTDVLLEHATLRVGPVPIFYSPYLWLRSPDRAGMLPPSFGYRSVEGAWLGSGFHVPFAAVDGGRRALDVGVAGYVRGGARVDAVLAGLGGRSTLAFDVFRREALDVLSAHAATREHQFFAERLDLVRGRRALEAPGELDRVALPSDRVRVVLGRADRSVFGLGVIGDARRGENLTELGVLGPSVVLGTGRGFGRFASYGISGGLSSARTPSGGSFVARGAADFTSALPLGVLRSELSARQRGELIQLEAGAARDLRSELRARLGLPLARRMTHLTHTVEPFAEAALETGLRSNDTNFASFTDLDAPRRAALAALGVDSALGSNSSRGAVELSVNAGLLADRASSDPVLGARSRLDAGPAQFFAVARLLPAASASEISLRAEARVSQHLGLGLGLDGARGEIRRADGLWRTDFSRPAGAMFDRSGWTARGRLRLPWGPGLFAELGSDVDISEKVWLASSAALGYRHRCRCLSLGASASRRLGRRGFDAGLNLELAPR